MSLETLETLNTQTLIGFTEKRGNAWHYREELQGSEPNHYPHAIPVDDVLRRLFNFEVVEKPLHIEVGGQMIEVPGRKAMVADDTNDVLGIFKAGYRGHRYQDWLVKNVANILDDDLGVGSAGLLRNRAQAWVSVEVPETITTPEGVEFRPNLLAATSFDGSLSTTYKRVVQVVVCDNTLAAGLGEKGQTYKIKHSKYSDLKIADARQALAVVHTIADDFAAEVTRLTAWKVETREFDLLLDALVPMPEGDATKRSAGMAERKREEIKSMYLNDIRVTPWKGTAFGVLQAFNTFRHHKANVKGVGHRAIRNMSNAVEGITASEDELVLSTLAQITVAA